MTDNRVTFIRKKDGVEVKVIMEPVGWKGYKKIYAGTKQFSPNSSGDDVYRITNAEFERDYELPTSIFRRLFRRGVR